MALDSGRLSVKRGGSSGLVMIRFVYMQHDKHALCMCLGNPYIAVYLVCALFSNPPSMQYISLEESSYF